MEVVTLTIPGSSGALQDHEGGILQRRSPPPAGHSPVARDFEDGAKRSLESCWTAEPSEGRPRPAPEHRTAVQMTV